MPLEQFSLLDADGRARAFGGSTYNPERDFERLSGLLSKVYDLMSDGVERSLKQIANATGGTEASVSARLRDLRKEQYGSHVVERRHVENGFYLYRLVG